MILTWAKRKASEGGLVLLIIFAAMTVFSALAMVAAFKPDPLSKVERKIQIPMSPGLVSAAEICKLGVHSSGTLEILGGEKQEAKAYAAVLGMDRLEWTDYPVGKNNVALLNGEPILINEEVMKCLRK